MGKGLAFSLKIEKLKNKYRMTHKASDQLYDQHFLTSYSLGGYGEKNDAKSKLFSNFPNHQCSNPTIGDEGKISFFTILMIS